MHHSQFPLDKRERLLVWEGAARRRITCDTFDARLENCCLAERIDLWQDPLSRVWRGLTSAGRWPRLKDDKGAHARRRLEF